MESPLFSLALVAGGLALFLHGLEFSADAFRRGLGNQARRLMTTMGRSRFLSFLFGSVMALLSQSTTAATAFAVGLVDVGALSFSSSLLVMMGASVGTTIVVFLLSLDLIRWSPLLLALSLTAERIGPRRFSDWARLFSGIALLLMGMLLIGQGVDPLARSEALRELILRGSGSALLLAILSLGATALFQSSVPVLALAIALASGGLLSPSAFLPVVLGSRIGNAATVLLAGHGGRHNARALALSTLLFRVIGVAAVIPLSGLFMTLASRLAPTAGGQIAWLQFLVAWLNVALLLPFVTALGEFALGRARRKRGDVGEPRFLDSLLAPYPQVALPLLAREMIGLANHVEELVFRVLHCQGERDHLETLGRGVRELARSCMDFIVAMTPPGDDESAQAEYASLTYSMAALKEIIDIASRRLLPMACAPGRAMAMLRAEEAEWATFVTTLNELVGEALGVLALGDRKGAFRAATLFRSYGEREEALRRELARKGFHPGSRGEMEAWDCLAATGALARASMELVRGETGHWEYPIDKEVSRR